MHSNDFFLKYFMCKLMMYSHGGSKHVCTFLGQLFFKPFTTHALQIEQNLINIINC